jgi:hypothetical protein
VLKTLGLTPAQVTSALASAQALLATAAALLSIALYLAVLSLTSGTTDGAVLAPWWHVALVPLAIGAAAALTRAGRSHRGKCHPTTPLRLR